MSLLRINKVSVPLNSLIADPLVASRITTDPQILAYVNTECPDYGYPKLKLYISKLILDSYEYIPSEHVTMHCIV